MPALQDLLNQIVDYAGLFPPAALPLPAVVKNYEKYVDSEQSWMLARLIIPAMKLEQFANYFGELYPNGLDQPKWKISALVPPVNAEDNGWQNAWDAIAAFNQNHDFAVVDTIEGKLPTADLLDATISGMPEGIAAFLEVAHGDPDSILQALSQVTRPNTFAKIRTGGVTEDLVPAPQVVAHFIATCAAKNIGFKATAGLHHPLRNEFPLTYQTDSIRGTLHGFLNVFVAAALANCHGWTAEQLLPVLQSGVAGDFDLAEDGIRFGDTLLTNEQLQQTRQNFAISFGSCSFIEPIEDLTALGWLANDAKTV